MDRLARILPPILVRRKFSNRRGAWRWNFLLALRHDFASGTYSVKVPRVTLCGAPHNNHMAGRGAALQKIAALQNARGANANHYHLGSRYHSHLEQFG